MKKDDPKLIPFSDDYIFCRTLSTNPDLVIRLVELITKRKILKVNYLDTQDMIKVTRDNKGIYMDVTFKDEQDNSYVIEMQNVNYPDFEKRVRYYESNMDVASVNNSPLS